MKHALIICFAILVAHQVKSQSSSIVALKTLQSTEFFNEYRELRERSQTAVKNFKIIQNRFSKEEIDNVIYAYNSSADYFNSALQNIKADLMQKDKRRYLISYPESYSKQVEADLYRAKEYYANTFQKEVTELTNGQITGAALIALLPQVIKYAKLAIEMIREIDSQIKKMNETVLDQYLIEPYRFKSWDEIQ